MVVLWEERPYSQISDVSGAFFADPNGYSWIQISNQQFVDSLVDYSLAFLCFHSLAFSVCSSQPGAHGASFLCRNIRREVEFTCITMDCIYLVSMYV